MLNLRTAICDWDVPLSEQPGKVRKILEKLGYDDVTGGEIYEKLSEKLGGDKEASKWLNRHKIPGLRYYDARSRDAKNGTHNFVIWNTKTLEAIGISQDSNKDAKEYFQKTATKQGKNVEIFNQILGEKGASELDKQEGVTYRMDNLKTAKEMTAERVPAKIIRMATGWEKDKTDGKWRWEILDGKFNWREVYKRLQNRKVPLEAHAEYAKLSEIFTNEELYRAYPELKDIDVAMWDEWGRSKGSYNRSTNTINLAMNDTVDGLQSTLTHEIQHAIQYIEGFATGGNEEMFEEYEISLENLEADLVWLKERLKHENSEAERDSLRHRIAELENRITDVKENALDGQVEADGEIYEDTYDAYKHLAGEAEARNAQKRASMTAEERRKTRLSETLDTDKKLIERYDQEAKSDDDGS